MFVYPNSDFQKIANSSSPVFQYAEKAFWKWLDASNPALEYKEQYFGEDAINDKGSAIVGSIEAALEEANESQKPVNLSMFDFGACFE